MKMKPVKPENYDETETFHKELLPRLQEVHAICERLKLPLSVMLQYRQEAEDDCLESVVCQMSMLPGPARTKVEIAAAAALLSEDQRVKTGALMYLLASLDDDSVQVHRTNVDGNAQAPEQVQ